MSVIPGAAVPGLAVPGFMTPGYPRQSPTVHGEPVFTFGAPSTGWAVQPPQVAWFFGAPLTDEQVSPPVLAP